jgi:NADH dehydrogenase/NADH:ubiquinone oxidoreductase subunit G
LNFNINNFNIISKFLGRLSSFEIGILPGIKSNLNFNYNKFKKGIFLHLCGIDYEIVKLNTLKLKNFIIYQGSFYINTFFKYLSLVLPVTIFTEKFSSYLNLEGRLRFTQKAITSFKSVFLD